MHDSRPRARVAHVVAAADFGGAESVVRSLATARHAGGGETLVVLLLQHEQPAPLGEALAREGVPVVELRCGRRRYHREIKALESTLRSWDITIVHSHVYHADFVALRAAQRREIPAVSTVHGFTAGSVKNRLFEWYDRRLLRHFDRVICVSEPQQAVLIGSGVSAQQIRVVRNGIAPPEFLDRRAARVALGLGEGPVIGWLGRFSAEKGPDQFVRSLLAFGREGVLGAMIGDGPGWADTESLVAATGANVRLLGRVPNAARALRAFDLVAMTSRTEGTPMLLLEAMAAGVPVASFSVGGVPAVIDESAGWLVAPGDIAGMASALRHALDDPAEAKRRAVAALSTLERDFGLPAWLRAVEAVYEEVRSPK